MPWLDTTNRGRSRRARPDRREIYRLFARSTQRHDVRRADAGDIGDFDLRMLFPKFRKDRLERCICIDGELPLSLRRFDNSFPVRVGASPRLPCPNDAAKRTLQRKEKQTNDPCGQTSMHDQSQHSLKNRHALPRSPCTDRNIAFPSDCQTP